MYVLGYRNIILEILLKNRLENCILTERDPPRVKPFWFFLQKKLSNGDLEGAVLAFEDQKTLVLKGDLTKAILTAPGGVNTELLQRVLDASIKLIGEEMSLYDLAFSFASAGQYTQAGKLFATPGLGYIRNR